MPPPGGRTDTDALKGPRSSGVVGVAGVRTWSDETSTLPRDNVESDDDDDDDDLDDAGLDDAGLGRAIDTALCAATGDDGTCCAATGDDGTDAGDDGAAAGGTWIGRREFSSL